MKKFMANLKRFFHVRTFGRRDDDAHPDENNLDYYLP